MKTTSTKTDNSYLADKVQLRADHLPDGEVTVLDCYAGQGRVWRGVAAITGRTIRRLPIEMGPLSEFHLPGDNRAYLETIDLARFNVVDLDAYGTPYAQLVTLLERGYAGTVFATFIQLNMSGVAYGLLEEIGFSRAMLERAPLLCSKDGGALFLEWLALRGVRRVWHRSHARKHYLAFTLTGRERAEPVGPAEPAASRGTD